MSDTPFTIPHFSPTELEPKDVRLEVVLKLIENGCAINTVEKTSEFLVSYILNGPTVEPKTVKKIDVFLPGDREVEANARLQDDGSILVEFRDVDLSRTVFDNFDLYGLSFAYLPINSSENTKDN